MLVLVLALLGFDPVESGRPIPHISGVWPPGVTIGERQVWTIAGRNLDRVQTVVASGKGLTFGPIVLDPMGQSLTVEVHAAADAESSYREIRVDGPSGISNLALVRVDPLAQVVEVEPNDQTPAPGLAIRVGTVVAGTIRALDVDRFRVEGQPGQPITIDWETRRLGTAILPVLTITGPDQAVIAEVRSAPGGDRDCRFALVIPPAGWFEVALRDNTYGGDDRARYRLRVDPLVATPRIPTDRPGIGEPVAIGRDGATILGRLDQPGEVDRFRFEARTGDRLRARVEAAPGGSWLDSVVTVLGPTGATLGENDDRAALVGPPATIDGGPDPDSLLDLTIAAAGPITIELADRSGAGGPNYPYQIEVGPPRTDLACYLLPGRDSADPGPEARSVGDLQRLDLSGAGGAFNLSPGSVTTVPFMILPRGRPGQVEVRVEGLPAGVEVEPVVVRLAPAPRTGSRAATEWDAPAVVDSLRFRVRPEARPVLGSCRIVARTRSRTEPVIEREAVRVVGVDAAGGAARPVIRRLTDFPVRVVAER